MRKTCILCSEPESLNCSSCDKGFCSSEHEDLHKLHNRTCMPLDIMQDDIKGRYVVASRNIKAGEILFVDRPIVVGPNHEVPPICITCFKEPDPSKTCSSCGYPLCNHDKCQVLHSSSECQTLTLCKRGLTEFKPGEVNYDNWFAVMPLRLLLLKKNKPREYALVDRLMDHIDQASVTHRWKDIDEKVIQRLEGCFTPQEIQRASGILDVNTYEIQTHVRGLLPLSALLSHGCTPNIEHHHSNNNPYNNTCRATKDILKGEEIFANYICPFLAYVDRQRRLKDGWYFDCRCNRCLEGQKEPLDHVKCPQCQAYTPPKQCVHCFNKFEGMEISKVISQYDELLNEIINNDRYNIQRYLDAYEQMKCFLHPQHELCIRLYRWLTPIFCVDNDQSFILRDIQMKKEMIGNLLEAINELTPGMNRYRGKALFELIDVDFKLLSYEYQGSSMDIMSLSKKIKCLIHLCKEVEFIFEVGDISSFEEVIQRKNRNKMTSFAQILKSL